jgi:hypothetical protein
MNVLNALKHVEASRLAKAATALMEGGYFVTISQCTPFSITGCVRGKEKSYNVTLTPTSARCECKDSQFHHSHCKHVAMLALTLIRAMEEVEQKRFHLGDEVEREGTKGKVIAVSGGTVSVKWSTGRISPHEATSVSVRRLPPRNYEDLAA